MKKYIFTDLACELPSDRSETKYRLGKNIEKIVYGDNGSNRGIQITFFTPKVWLLSDREFRVLVDEIANELHKFTEYIKRADRCLKIIVIGIGNPSLTTDSLGPETVNGIYVTDPTSQTGIKMTAISPNVAGNTGIETIDAVRAYVSAIRPDAAIVVDSLRARSYERLATTVQLSYNGIIPGSGNGKGGVRINEATIGIPVISVGVPTVVNSSTLIYETLEKCDVDLENEKLLKLLENNVDFFVSPKEVDILVKSASLMISTAINSAFYGK